MARPPKGPDLVDTIEGSDFARERLRAVLETVAGQITIKEACARLGIGEARFHVLRRQVLETAMADLAPKPIGRPAAPSPSPETTRVAELEAQVAELSLELEASRVREELALALPGRGQKKAPAQGGHPSRAARRRAERAQRKADRKRR